MFPEQDVFRFHISVVHCVVVYFSRTQCSTLIYCQIYNYTQLYFSVADQLQFCHTTGVTQDVPMTSLVHAGPAAGGFSRGDVTRASMFERGSRQQPHNRNNVRNYPRKTSKNQSSLLSSFIHFAISHCVRTLTPAVNN